jgi:hypothetical protein
MSGRIEHALGVTAPLSRNGEGHERMPEEGAA